jgi:hypothetical protein
VRPVVHLEHLADDLRIPAMPALPVVVAQHQHRVGPGQVVFGAEVAAEQRSHPEEVEEVGRDDAGLDALRFGAAQQRERHRVVLDEAFERLAGGPVVEQLLLGEADARRGRLRQRLAQYNEPLGLAVGERPEQHAVHDAEDRGVGADAEREREHDRDREGRRLAQAAQAVADVLRQALERSRAPRVAHLLLRLVDAAQADARRAAGFVLAHAGHPVFLGLQLEVHRELGVELALEPRAAAQRLQAEPELAREPHGYAVSSTRKTAEARRCQFCLLALELALAVARELVELRASVVLGRAPLARDPALFLEPIERGVERALVHDEHAVAHLLDALGDAPAVHRARRRACAGSESRAFLAAGSLRGSLGSGMGPLLDGRQEYRCLLSDVKGEAAKVADLQVV